MLTRNPAGQCPDCGEGYECIRVVSFFEDAVCLRLDRLNANARVKETVEGSNEKNYGRRLELKG